MTSSRLPEKPIDLFDLANEVVDALAENATFASLKTALELMTKLTAAMYAYGAYLAIEDGAKHSPSRGLLKHAAQTWQRTEEELRQWLLVLPDYSIVSRPCRMVGPA